MRSPYQIGTGDPFSGDKAAEAWSWPTPSSADINNVWIFISTYIYIYGVTLATLLSCRS